jgi:serine/threonine-protein kinase
MSEAPHIENFEVNSLLGRGGMATVWKARQTSLDRFVAIKVLSSAFATDPADIARFREEARAAGRLKHPGIVQVYDANFNNGCYYFVMELVDGYTVGEWVRRKGKLAENDALTVAESVIAALDYAWTNYGIIHCDIKPENIMVDADGTVKTADLGLARAIVSMQTREPEQEVLGTPAYMSPEQVTGQPDLDCRADIYALGATLYHMVTGHPLFAGQAEDELMQQQLTGTVPSPSREVQGLSHGFVLLLARMLAKDRKYRPNDWKAVTADVRRVRDRRTPLGHEPPPGSSTIFIDASESDAVRRHTMQAVSAATPGAADPGPGARLARLLLWVLLVLMIGGGVWWFAFGGARQVRETPSPMPAPFADDDRYKAALAYVADHPADLAGGIERLEEVLSRAPVSWYAQQARVQRDRLLADRDSALQAIYRRLDAQARALVSRNRMEEARLLLERYQGPYAAETAAWRHEQAQMLRGSPPAPRPRP